MRLTLEHYDSKISVETARDNLDIGEVVEELIKPVLLAAGFALESVKEVLGDE